jgi:phosphonate transport system substrate-binding protein
MNQNIMLTQRIWLLVLAAIVVPAVHGSAQPTPGSPAIKFTIIPHRSYLGNEQAYSRMIAALAEETGYTFTWVGSRSYEDVIDKLRTGRADIGYLGPFSYVTAQDAFGVRLLARIIDKDGTAFYQSMIITRRDAGLNTLEDLKGKRLAFTDPKSTSGFLFPMAALKKAGLSLTDFSEVLYAKRHANSALAVYYGQADAGATASTIRDRIDIDFTRLRILWKSEPIYRGPWAARKDLPDIQFKAVQEALFQLSRRPDRDRIFGQLQTNGFVKGSDRDYDNVRETLKWTDALD